MTLEARDFPLYELIHKLGGENAARARASFLQAQHGNDQDRFDFALQLYGVATPMQPPSNPLPGETKEIDERTLESCLKLFEQAAAHGHGLAAYVSAECYFSGHGCRQDFNKARYWVEKAEAIEGSTP